MKFLVDAHLPKSICGYFIHCDCIHINDLEAGNLTKDTAKKEKSGSLNKHHQKGKVRSLENSKKRITQTLFHFQARMNDSEIYEPIRILFQNSMNRITFANKNNCDYGY